MSESGSNKKTQQTGKHQFTPSPEVAEKMRPISRSVFHNILQRAAKPLSRKLSSKKH
jgi:hypothetical protein